MNIQTDIMLEAIRYVSEVLGETIPSKPTKISELKSLPYAIRDSFDLFRTKILRRGVILVQKKDHEITPKKILASKSTIERNLAAEDLIVFVFDRIQPHERQRLIQQGVYFVVPWVHMFLPPLGVDFRSRSRRGLKEVTTFGSLSAPAQSVLLYHLQCQSLSGMLLRQVAEITKYARFTISRTIQELIGAGLASTEKVGVNKHLEFKKQGADLWQAAKPFLSSPVKKTWNLKFLEDRDPFLLEAGMTALASKTSISSGGESVHAIGTRDLQVALSQSKAVKGVLWAEGVTTVQQWNYNPRLLSSDRTVDSLALFLSLQDDPDERIQIALDELMRDMKW